MTIWNCHSHTRPTHASNSQLLPHTVRHLCCNSVLILIFLEDQLLQESHFNETFLISKYSFTLPFLFLTLFWALWRLTSNEWFQNFPVRIFFIFPLLHLESPRSLSSTLLFFLSISISFLHCHPPSQTGNAIVEPIFLIKGYFKS